MFGKGSAEGQILSQLTTRLRLYGANCNDTALVMQAIQDTKVDMTIWPAICTSDQ
jgi:glucan 1,3-beta-glucosidase